MKDGISKPELDGAVHDLVNGKTFDEVVKKHFSQVDPQVVALNRESIIKLAHAELRERLVTPERKAIGDKLEAELKPAKKGKAKDAIDDELAGKDPK